uniref:Uncharacterized protein n=1 Tax=Anolis carolinensis TaxID=28377 RepID=A0A803SVZ9_ANOCA
MFKVSMQVNDKFPSNSIVNLLYRCHIFCFKNFSNLFLYKCLKYGFF